MTDAIHVGHIRTLRRVEDHLMKDSGHICGHFFRVDNILGCGSYGIVIGTHDNGGYVAKFSVIDDGYQPKDARREFNIQRSASIDNQYVAKVKNILFIDDIHGTISCMIMPRYMCNLVTFLKGDSVITETLQQMWFAQILCAMSTFHEQGMFHGDIKPENILVDDNLNVYISDFGSARYIPSKGSLIVLCAVTTTPARAPELYIENCRFNCSADWWSTGTALFELLNFLKARQNPHNARARYLFPAFEDIYDEKTQDNKNIRYSDSAYVVQLNDMTKEGEAFYVDDSNGKVCYEGSELTLLRLNELYLDALVHGQTYDAVKPEHTTNLSPWGKDMVKVINKLCHLDPIQRIDPVNALDLVIRYSATNNAKNAASTAASAATAAIATATAAAATAAATAARRRTLHTNAPYTSAAKRPRYLPYPDEDPDPNKWMQFKMDGW
jgi:serine/threonine protein kinase